MGKGSLARISVALAIISIYIFLFGFTVRIESLDDSIPDESRQTEKHTEAEPSVPATDVGGENNVQLPVTTSAAEEKTIYTYATTLNVVNGKKPGLADYTATHAMMIIPEAAAAPTTPTASADVVLDDSSFAYETTFATTAKAETTASTTTTAAVTTTPETTTTTAPTVATTAETTTAAPAETSAAPDETTDSEAITTLPPYIDDDDDDAEDDEDDEDDSPYSPEDIDDIEDDPEDVVPEDPEPEETVPEETVPEETSEPEPVVEPEQPEVGETLSIYTNGQVVTGDAVSLVAQAVMAEVGDSFHEEAIKAQAIATYTYFKYYNNNNQNAYAVLKTPSDVVTRCVSEVIGKTVRYNGSIIQAVYGASTAGYTASSLFYWGIDYPYLQSRKCDFDALYDVNYGRQVTFTADEVREFVEKNTGIMLNDDPQSWFEITSRTDGAFVGTMKIGGLDYYNYGGRAIQITGRVFRETVMEFNLRSASFDISYDPATASFTFTTYGYGHCVGMSQHGANILATQFGYNYEDILKFYYQGTEVY